MRIFAKRTPFNYVSRNAFSYIIFRTCLTSVFCLMFYSYNTAFFCILMHGDFSFSFQCYAFSFFSDQIFCFRYFAASIFCVRYFATSIFRARYFVTWIFCLSIFFFSIFCLFDILPFQYFVLPIFCFRYFVSRYFAYSIFCDSILCVFECSVQQGKLSEGVPPPPSLGEDEGQRAPAKFTGKCCP